MSPVGLDKASWAVVEDPEERVTFTGAQRPVTLGLGPRAPPLSAARPGPKQCIPVACHAEPWVLHLSGKKSSLPAKLKEIKTFKPRVE